MSEEHSHVLYRGWPARHPRAVRAQGRHIETADGRRLLDGASGALAATLGYGVPEVAAAVGRQARELAFAHSLQFTTEVVEEYAAALASVLRDRPREGAETVDRDESGDPGSHGGARGGASARARDAAWRVLLVTSGTEAVEMALLLAHRIQAARGEPARRLYLGRHLSYHGASLATLALGGRRSLRAPLAALLEPTSSRRRGGLSELFGHLPPPFPYRPEWHARFPGSVADVDGIDHLLRRPLSGDELERARAHPAEAVAVSLDALEPDTVCAFVAEPIIGASAGAVVPPDDYWPRVREACDRHGVLWIADEVMTGIGRTGGWLACAHWEAAPDVVCLGKGLGAGHVPLAAVAIRQADYAALTAEPPGIPHGLTFAHHPVAAAAGHAVLEVLKGDGLVERAGRLGEVLRDRLGDALRDHPHLGEIRGRGLMLGLEIVADRGSRRPFPASWNATGRLLRAAEEAGVLLYPARGCADGVAGDAVLVAPALTITDDELDELVAGVGAGLEELEHERRRDPPAVDGA